MGLPHVGSQSTIEGIFMNEQQGVRPTERMTYRDSTYSIVSKVAYGRYFGDEQAARKNMKQRVDELREELPPGHPDWKPRRHRKDPGMER